MLMTNFSAGELSKYLLGRIDIPQYKNGAARIENFNVIPTGGIKRRSGMEWLKNLGEDGRLIPFIADRGLVFLLYLSAGSMQIFKVADGNVSAEGKAVTEISGKNLYNAEEIAEVQYAQTYDTMVLCHQNHPPLEIKLEKNNQLIITSLAITNDVKIIATYMTEEEIQTKYPDGIKDEYFANDGFLRGLNNYPRCASFLNGRIIFAGTINDPQRIFVSKILTRDDKIKNEYPFATYNHLITKRRKYVSVLGTICPEDTSVIILPDIYERFKFTDADLWKYTVESPFYPENTKITKLEGDKLKLSEPGKTIPPLTDGEKKEIEDKATVFKKYNDYKTDEGTVGTISFSIQTSQGPLISGFSVSLKIGVSEYELILSDSNKTTFKYYFDDDVAKKTQQYIHDSLFSSVSIILNSSSGGTVISRGINVETAATKIWGRILETMRYDFHLEEDYGSTYYGNPNNILSEVELKFGTAKMFITFYTDEYEEDSQPTPDCGFTFEVASDMNDAIRWLSVNRGLIVGTEMGEYTIPPDAHALNQRAEKNSSYGSDHIQGTAVGDATVFFQSGKKSLVEYYIPQADNHFRANNMALLSQQMLDESPAREIDYITSPHAKLLITRDDGTVAALLYERSTGTFAWSRITTGPERIEGLDKFRRKKRTGVLGKVRSAAVLPGRGGFDEVYMIVERHGKFALERLRENGPVFLDCWREWKWGPGTEYATREALLAAYGEGAVIWDEVENRKDPDNMAKKDPADEKLFRRMEERFADDLPKFDDSITREYVRVTARLDVPKFKEFLAYLKIPPEERERMKEEAAQKEREERKKSQKYKSAISLIPIGSADKLPPESADEEPRYIGYPYTSILRTMPVIGNAEMQQHRISSLAFRFLDSFLPHMTSIRKGEPGPTDCLTHAEAPCTGIYEQPFPGTWDEQVQAELYADVPGPVTILTLDAITSKPHAGGAK